MPKNKGKGGKSKRRGRNESQSEQRELVFKEDGQEYAQVTRMLGNCRLEAACFDGVTRLCIIRGKMRNKVWISQGDVLLLGLRDFQDHKADVILRYSEDEARCLRAYGEIPTSVLTAAEAATFVSDGIDDDIQFGDVGGDDPGSDSDIDSV